MFKRQIFSLLAALTLPTPVQPATITAKATGSLADEIGSANNDSASGGCTAGSGAETIGLTENMSVSICIGLGISSDMTIEGNGYTITSTGSDKRHFRVASSNTNFSLKNVMLRGDAILFDNSSDSLTITNSDFDDGNRAGGGSGSALYTGSNTSSTLSDVTMLDNPADSSACAAYPAPVPGTT